MTPIGRAKDTWSHDSCRAPDYVTRLDKHNTLLCATSFSLFNMAAAQEGQFLKQASGRNTRGLLRVIILCLIAGAAVSSRLFSVIRFESIIHECQYLTGPLLERTVIN